MPDHVQGGQTGGDSPGRGGAEASQRTRHHSLPGIPRTRPRLYPSYAGFPKTGASDTDSHENFHPGCRFGTALEMWIPDLDLAAVN